VIVPMKRVSLLVMDRDKDAALNKIRDLGVIHLERKAVSSPALTRLLDRRVQLDIASGVLASFTPKKKSKDKEPPPKFDGDLTRHVVALSDRRKKLQDYIFNHQREMSHFEKWGEFEPKDFAYLKEHGVNAQLYDITSASYEKNTHDVPHIVLSSDKKNNSVRLLAFDAVPNEHPYVLPERPLSLVNERDKIRKAEMVKIEDELTALSSLKKQVEDQKASLLSDIEFETANSSMEHVENDAAASDVSISWISGYVPAPDMGLLKRAASENGWALCAADPVEDDTQVPTKLKNNKLTEFLYPLTGFLEMSPGYREVDISGWFLLFFTLFFGMIFGDAAYGTILCLIAIFFILKTSKKGTPPIFKFMLLMSLSNLAWGILTCAWFGFDVSAVPQVLQNISLPLIVNTSDNPAWLAAYNANNFWIRSGLVSTYDSIDAMGKGITSNLMLFCFSVALTQLGIAHIKGIIANIKSKSPRVLAELGQLGMLIGMYFVVLSLVVFNTGFGGVKTWQFCSLFGGFALNFVFGNYEGSVLKSFLTSCANILTNVLNITSVFSDIMSYIRLWAVGLAGASIASTVNGFAGPLVSHFVFFIFGVVLFLFGHSFNMVLNVLSVLVHGVRLNTLEFSSHLGLTWSGFSYKPFAKR